jgi:hypothetical protein
MDGNTVNGELNHELESRGDYGFKTVGDCVRMMELYASCRQARTPLRRRQFLWNQRTLANAPFKQFRKDGPMSKRPCIRVRGRNGARISRRPWHAAPNRRVDVKLT